MKMNNEAHQTPYFEPCSNVIKCGKHYIMCEKLKICVMTCKILLTPNFWNSYIKKTIMFSSSKTKYGVGLSQKHVTFQKVDSSVTSNNSILWSCVAGVLMISSLLFFLLLALLWPSSAPENIWISSCSIQPVYWAFPCCSWKGWWEPWNWTNTVKLRFGNQNSELEDSETSLKAEGC